MTHNFCEKRVVGLDISTYCGLALVEGEAITGKAVHFPKTAGWDRLHLIAMEVRRVLEQWQPQLVVVEAYAVYRVSSVVTVIECGTVVRKTLYDLGHAWWEVPPTVLKKWLTGKGTAKKPDMLAATLSRWGYASPSDDVVDAVALAKMGATEDLSAFKGCRISGRR